ncbi:MAG: SDR family NAD(P)-dependent oxidoreductase [Clostridiaceae bacterium]|nr:SDR family NAD(P)-dependent oxidoreductase [Clostridiaceae bacterium]
MEKAYKYIAEEIAAGRIAKQAAIELVKLLKSQEKKVVKDIAIIGMATTLPKAKNTREYWNNIKNGVDCIDDFPIEREKEMKKYIYGVKGSDSETKFCRGGFLDEIDKFDHKFFKMTPKQAALMDPNHRIMLETMWAVIEDSGYGGDKIKGSQTGVYIGFANPPVGSYSNAVYEIEPDSMQIAMTGNIAAILPGRISYILDLKGPSILIDTACSSSIVTVHMACQGIENGDCDMAIAGGIKLHLSPIDHPDGRLGIESSDWRTKTYDYSSDGTGIGEGSAAVMLKSLSKALEDGDNIYAVIKGSAINQDGTSVGITAPNAEAQSQVIMKAWENAGIDPESISYIEAHGTGTKIGDPIEIEGISKAFRHYTDKKQFCAIGSVKSNIGHLYEGAGIAGLIKLVLSLKEKKIPPLLHFNRPNEKISFEDSPVYVNNVLSDWETDGFPRRAGISAFGFGGTNCHVVLEEAPELEHEVIEEKAHILTLSAKSGKSVQNMITDYIDFIKSAKDVPVRDICYTASTGRGHYEHRLAIIIKNVKELEEKLQMLAGADLKEINVPGVYYGENKPGKDSKDSKETGNDENDKLQMLRQVLDKIVLLKEDITQRWSAYEDICKLYVQGADVPWDKMYEGEKVRRVSLPTYPFERIKCWFELPEIDSVFNVEPDPKEGRLHYQVCWQEEEIGKEEADSLKGKVLIIKDGKGLADGVAQKLRAAGREVIEVSYGIEYSKVNGQNYTIKDCQEDYEKLVAEISKQGVSQILHMGSLAGGYEPVGEQEQENVRRKGIFSLYYLVKALAGAGISDKLDILLVSELAYEVTGNEELIIPDNTTIFGLGKVVGREYSFMECRGLDIDKNVQPEDIISELNAKYNTFQCAYRNGKRYIEEFAGLDVEDLEDEKVELKEDGVYVITGGLGGIGLAVAKNLASRAKINIAMINRSQMPEREQWDDIINSSTDKRACERINEIREIEAMGASVSCYSADVKDENEMSEVIGKIRSTYGRINGVIHGAGLPGDTLIALKEEDKFNNVLLTKVRGARILDKLTEQDNPDFFMLFSSVASIISMSGQGDYAAANLFLDSYAYQRSRQGKKTLSINWVQWKETGMAVDTGANVDTMFKAISTENALRALDEALNKKVRRVLIGELNYENRIVGLIDKGYLKISPKILAKIRKYGYQATEVNKQKKPVTNVVLKGREDGIYSETEKKAAQIWGEIFGYSELGIEDNFYDLGGDSILAMKLVNQVSVSMNITIGISDILNCLTVRELAEYIDKKLQENSGTDTGESISTGIEPAKPMEFYPVSSAQKRMLIMDEVANENTSYNIPEVRVLGAIDRDRFEYAMKKMFERHEACRTSFEFRNGEYVQIIHDNIDLKINYLQIETENGKEPDIDGLLLDFVKPFKLSEAPLLRVQVVKAGEDRNILMVDFHHIIWDAVSKSLFIDEFMRLYEGEELPGQLLQYKDYTVWQNQRLSSGSLDKQGEFWLKQFEDKVDVPELPTDFPRPEQRSFRGSNIRFKLEKDLIDGIHDLCSKTETTLFMVLISAYNILLSKYSGQEDIVIGTPITGRVHADLENIMGLFVNTLPMRNQPKRDKTFKDFLKDLRNNTLNAFENQEYPFEELLEKLNLTVQPGRNPLFDTFFVLQNVHISFDAVIPVYEIKSRTSKFDLMLEAIGGKDYLFLTFEYCTDLFREETIARMGQDYIRILEEVAANQDILIGDIRLEQNYSKVKSKINEDVEFDF